MKVKLDEDYEIEIPEHSKGVHVNKNWSIWADTEYYTIEFYIDKKEIEKHKK